MCGVGKSCAVSSLVMIVRFHGPVSCQISIVGVVSFGSPYLLIVSGTTFFGAAGQPSTIASTSLCVTTYFAPGARSSPLAAFSCCAPTLVFTTVSTRSFGSIGSPVTVHVMPAGTPSSETVSYPVSPKKATMARESCAPCQAMGERPGSSTRSFASGRRST